MRVESWCLGNAPVILDSFNPPATQEEIDIANDMILSNNNIELPKLLKLLYRFHNGQRKPEKPTDPVSCIISIKPVDACY